MSEDKKNDEAFSNPAGHRARLRLRYANGGFSALADYEVVEFLLMLAIPRVDVKPIAKELIAKFGNVREILNAEQSELLKIKGLGESAAISVSFIRDFISQYFKNELEEDGECIESISRLKNFFRSRLDGMKNEALELVCLDTKLRVIKNGALRMFEGSVNSANVDVRRIVETALRLGASSIAIAHNHPSGNPRASLDDIRFTKRLTEACKPLGVCFIEHIIVGKNSCYSFRLDGHFDVLYDDAIEESRIEDCSDDARQSVAEGKRRISEF